MQKRMKEFSLSKEKTEALLLRAQVGRLSTIGADGYPYTVAVHFVYDDGKIYFHGLSRGEKLENIRRTEKVCFETDEMTGLLLDKIETPCLADTEYESAVIKGDAGFIEDTERKKYILNKIIAKYAPSCSKMEIPEAMIKATAVVEIKIRELTGKYHK